MSSPAPTTACPVGRIDYTVFEPWSDATQSIGKSDKELIFKGHHFHLFSEETSCWWEDRCVTKITPENATSENETLPSERDQALIRMVNDDNKKSRVEVQRDLEELARLSEEVLQRTSAPVQRVTIPPVEVQSQSATTLQSGEKKLSCITVVAIAILVLMFAVGVFGFAGLIPIGSILSGALILVSIACAGVGFFCCSKN